nr:UxaA family hydrolase [Tepidanaerobacter acetatoxydans]
MSEEDNVAIAIQPLKKGDVVEIPNGRVVKAAEDIPISHKIAIAPIKIHEPVIRYGSEIGYATCEIAQGQWVHIHNIDAFDII